MTADPRERIEQIFRDECARLTAWLTRRTGSFEIAEDSVAEAFSEALQSWTETAFPTNPNAWLVTTARRRAVDRLRQNSRSRVEAIGSDLATWDQELSELAVDDPGIQDLSETALRDEQLALVFLCCHPALGSAAQVALTLKSVGGLSTDAIASAFLQSESTVSQRIVRAKRKISEAGIPFRMPSDADLPARLRSVLRVVYLLFNEDFTRVEVSTSAEARRLAALLVELMPDEAEVRGLHALLTLLEARRGARFDQEGSPVRLPDQDRSTWDQALISIGELELERALGQKRPGPYQIQAAIAALHARARDYESTDWPQIALLYDRLVLLEPGPVVELNRIVANAMFRGPEFGIAALERLSQRPELVGYPFFFAARAEMHRRAGDLDSARADLDRAIELAPDDGERRRLLATRATL